VLLQPSPFAVLVLKLGDFLLLCTSAQEHTFDGQENACNLAYSAVQVPAGQKHGSEMLRGDPRLFPKPSDVPAQVECDVCRACSIQEAGCGDQGPGSDPYDCSTAAADSSSRAARHGSRASCRALMGAVGLLAEAMPPWATGPGLGPEPEKGKICSHCSHCDVVEVPGMVAREEGLVLPERAEGLPEPGHASGLRCWRRHGLEASRQQGEQPWPASHAQKLAAERAAADLRKVFVSNHWTWQAAHGARFVVCNACAVRFR